MSVINDFLEWLQDESVSTGLKVVAVAGVVGMVATLCGAIFSAFTGKLGRTLKWLLAFGVIALLMGSGYTVMKSLAQGTGEDIENQVNMLGAFALVPAYGSFMVYKRHKKKDIK